MSRVVSVRLADSTIAGCYDLLESKGFDTTKPLGTIISTVLASTIEQFRHGRRIIPIYDTEQEATLAVEGRLTGKGVQLSELDDLTIVTPHRSEEALREMIHRKVNEVLPRRDIPTEDSLLPGEIYTPEEERTTVRQPPRDVEPPWTKVNKAKFDTIQRVCPKNMWVEQAEDGNKLVEMALRVVCGHLEADKWGSQIMDNMVEQTIGIFQPHWQDEEQSDENNA
jgi:hypothetical protein